MSDNAPSLSPTIVLVGHCGFDGAALVRFAKAAVPDAQVVAAHHTAELEPHTHGRSLWLVNRVLDGGFDSDRGVDLIRRHAGGGDAPRMMLVSNYDDAQKDAREAGALEGFGKASLGDPTTAQRLRDALTDVPSA